MQTYLFVLIGYLISTALGQYYFVTFPNVIRFNNDETVSVNVFGLTNAEVEVWLEVKEGDNVRKFSEHTVLVRNENAPVIIHVKVTEANILPDVEEDGKPIAVTVCSRYANQMECQEIPLSYETGYLIVQTDKPIYTPNQRVIIRALAFDESLKVGKNEVVWMDIIEWLQRQGIAFDGAMLRVELLDLARRNKPPPSYAIDDLIRQHGHEVLRLPPYQPDLNAIELIGSQLKSAVRRRNSPSNQTLGRIKKQNSFTGFYRHSFDLPPHPETGVWTARAYLRRQYETTSKATFQVNEYVLPTYGVTIEVDVPSILPDTNELEIAVKARYVYGEPVNGNARLDMYLSGEGEDDKPLLSTAQRTLLFTGDDHSIAVFNVQTSDIMNTELVNIFPEGKRFKIIATVYEEETGIEKNDLHDKTLFTRSPFRFKFSRSKTNFRPGLEYFLKVDLFYPNGAPVSDQAVHMELVGTKTVEVLTDSNGRASSTFETTHIVNTITFKVRTNGFGRDWESDEFQVERVRGKNQIEVELATVNGGSELRAYTNTQGEPYTGMLFMVVTRGKIVKTEFKSTGNKVSVPFSDILKRQVSPSGRLLVFYVDTNSQGEIVANSVKFDVEHVCRGKELTLTPENTWINPGETSHLKISGDKDMFVGLNIMDKALFLSNNKNILKRIMLFDILDSHDLGCKEGGGSNSAEVFKKAGITVLTNAKIDKNLLKGKAEECDLKHRARRFAEQFKQVSRGFRSSGLFDTNSYTEDLYTALEMGSAVRVRSDFRESWEFIRWDLDGNGNREIKLSYPDSITEWIIQAVGISSEGVCIAEPANVKPFRKFFIQLYLPYKAIRFEQVEVKVTVFNYENDNMTANVYLYGTRELCYESEAGISKPTKRTTVIIPSHSAHTVRFPVIPLKKGQFYVRAFAYGNTGFEGYADEVVKQLFVDNEGIEKKISIQVCLDPHNQTTDCKQDMRVSSNVIIVEQNEATQVLKVNLDLPDDAIPNTGSGTGYVQGVAIKNVIKPLLQEGVEYLLQMPKYDGERTIMILASTVYAMKYMKHTRTMGAESEKKGNEYIKYGINREISMYRHPDGSYSAWQHRPSSTCDLLEKSVRANFEYANILTYAKKKRLIATRLTAFVAKVFCQAKHIVDDAVDPEEDIRITIQWLVNEMGADGSYIENMPVIHREMIGQVKETNNAKHPSLAAFVLISLQECSYPVKELQVDVLRTMQHVENLDKQMLRNNPYILAISTYALALSNSTKKYEFLKMLHDIKVSSADDGTHWGNAGGQPASASSVETTSYALLAMLQFQDYKTSGDVVKWLTSQREGNGAFRSTQETVVGLQALSEYSIRTASPKLNLKVSLLADQWKNNEEFRLTHENAIFQKVIKNLPVEIGRKELIIKVSGQGSGRMMIDLRYNRHGTKNERCGFIISDIMVSEVNELNQNFEKQGLMECDVCGHNCDRIPYWYENEADVLEPKPRGIFPNLGRKKRSRRKRVSSVQRCTEFSLRSVSGRTGMAVVMFGLETGVEIISSDIDKLIKESEYVDGYRNDGKGFVVFYLSEITTAETRFKFRLKDTFDDEAGKLSRQPAVVTVYDYHNPDITCTKMYRSIGETFSMKCDNSSSSMTCQCMSSRCPQALDEKLVEQSKKRQRPALELKRYTCNIDHADFAVLVEIDDIVYDTDLREIKVNAIVTKSINQGKYDLTNEGIVLIYLMDCRFPVFIIGNEYYIIAQESIKKYEYVLSSSTLIIEKPPPGTMLYSIMKKYERFMGRGCDD